MSSFDPRRRATLACVSGAFLTRSSIPAVASAKFPQRAARTVCVLDHIPESLHEAIRTGRCKTDLATFFQAATVEANDGRARGEGPGGIVLVPAGTYPISGVGIRDTIIVGEHRTSSRIVAVPSAASGKFLLDAMIDRDGATHNTSGGGYASHLVIDASGANASGLRTYGGGCTPQDLTIIGAKTGLAAGLPMWSTFSNIHTVDCETGILTFATEKGDSGTSSTFLNCWANRSKRYGFHVTQLMYSAFVNCAAQDSGIANFFVEGDVNGAAAAYSLQLIGCGTEGGGKPFYLRKCRDLTLMGARVIAPAPELDHITFDDSAGSIRDFSTVSPPTPPALSVRLVNHGAPPGGVVIDGSIVAIDPRFRPFYTLVGGSLNEHSGMQAPALNIATLAGEVVTGIETIGDMPALTLRSANTRLAAFPLSGGSILSVSGRNMAEAIGEGEVALSTTDGGKGLRLLFKDDGGNVRAVDLPGRLVA